MQRDKTIDVLKGIAIISVVLGHAWNCDHFDIKAMKIAHDFVYTYHIILFVFISGYLFHHMSIKTYVVKRIKSLYILTVVAVFFSFLLYPIWRLFGIVEPQNITYFIKGICKAIVFVPNGIFTGALWYVPYIFGMGMAALLILILLHMKFMKDINFILWLL